MDSWFTVEQIDCNTFAISEYKHWEETHSYLLCGEKMAVLIDTGLGISNIKKNCRYLNATAYYGNYYSYSLGSHRWTQIF